MNINSILSTPETFAMSDFSHTHAALFDELERQGVFCVDVGKLAQAVLQAQAIIAGPSAMSCSREAAPYQRCETCE